MLERQVNLHHPFCQRECCEVCLNDHYNLGEYLKSKCGNLSRVDWLGEYRTFMDKRMGHSTETKWGWGDPVIFKSDHVEAFILSWHEEF